MGIFDGIVDLAVETVDTAVGAVEYVTDPVVDTAAQTASVVGGTVGSLALEVVVGGIVGSGDALAMVAGAFGWLSDNIDVIPNVAGISGLLSDIFGGIAGFFGFLADVVNGIHDIMQFLSTRSGVELMMAMIGIIMLILGVYLIASMVISGQIIFAPAYMNSIFYNILLIWFGLGALLYSMDPVMGSGLIGGSGIALAMLGQGADEEEFVIPGLVAAAVGIPMTTTAFHASSAITVMAFVGVIGAIYSIEQLQEVA